MRANKGFVKLRSPVTAAITAVLLCGAAQAGTVSWKGTSGNWHETWHWSIYALPGPNDDVVLDLPDSFFATVRLGAEYPPQQYTPIEIGSLTVGRGNRIEIYGTSLQVSGGIVNDGELHMGTGYYNGSVSTFKIGTDTTLAGKGTVSLAYGGVLDLNSHSLTIGSSQTVRGAGDINNGHLINQGLLAPDDVLSFDPSVAWVDNTAGRISIGANGILSANSTNFTGGRIDSASGGGIGGAPVAAGPAFSNVTFSGDAKIYGRLLLVDSTNQGTLRVNNSAVITARNTLVNDGDIRVDSEMAFQGDTKLTGSGTVWLGRTPWLQTSGYLDVAANSTLTIDSAQTVRGSGRIRIADGSRVVNHGSIIAEEGGVYVTFGNGTLDNSAGHITVTHDGAFAIYANLILGDGSTLTFDIGSSAADHGMLYTPYFMSQALDGTLELNIGYAAQVGDSFTLLSSYGGAIGGTFDQVIAAGYTVSTSYNASDVTVTITGISPVPEPASWLLAGSGLVMIRRRLKK